MIFQISLILNFILQNKIGCTAFSEVCGNDKDSPSTYNEFLLIAQQKAMFFPKNFAKPEEKSFFNEYVSDEELNIILQLISFE
jgi:hypothetical protein